MICKRSRAQPRRAALGAVLFLVSGCAADSLPAELGSAGAGGEGSGLPEDLPYATKIESFTPGDGAGYGQKKLPDVVLGPPRGLGTGAGGLHVLSLGAGGEIVLSFAGTIGDGEGPDFVVFENAFWPNGAASEAYVELGEVSVSQDARAWVSFDCDREGVAQPRFLGCAGVSPTLEFDPGELVPIQPARTGGDAFDLAKVGLKSASFVRIRDLSSLESAAPSAGFDLDAVGVVHLQ
jgi:hypothetical protein